MAWVTPQPGTAGQVYTAAAHNVIVDDLLAGLPIVTTAERNAITSPSTGSEVYNTTTGAYEMYTGSGWEISRPFRMQSGTISITTNLSIVSGPFAGGYYQTATVTLDSGRFSQAPIVTVGVQTTQAAFAWLPSTPTTGSFAIGVVAETNAAQNAYWHAVQMTSAASAG